MRRVMPLLPTTIASARLLLGARPRIAVAGSTRARTSSSLDDPPSREACRPPALEAPASASSRGLTQPTDVVGTGRPGRALVAQRAEQGPDRARTVLITCTTRAGTAAPARSPGGTASPAVGEPSVADDDRLEHPALARLGGAAVPPCSGVGVRRERRRGVEQAGAVAGVGARRARGRARWPSGAARSARASGPAPSRLVAISSAAAALTCGDANDVPCVADQAEAAEARVNVSCQIAAPARGRVAVRARRPALSSSGASSPPPGATMSSSLAGVRVVGLAEVVGGRADGDHARVARGIGDVVDEVVARRGDHHDALLAA